jgi:cytosine/adenosine deaminase-related metal-dependent hydrolase
MNAEPSRGMLFLNAHLGGRAVRRSLRVANSRIAELDAAPSTGDWVVDLRGDRLLPGLINSHDHLHLNTLPPLDPTGHWTHAREWVAQVNLRRRTDPAFESRIAVALNERLLIGGIKNLLSGVTTVAHHDPLYPFLLGEHFPTSVVRNFGWSHSLYIDGDDEVRESYLRTPPDWPWIIHLGEGVNREAAGEFERLAKLGCLRANTLLVHGIALSATQRRRLAEANAGLIWCPSSNLRLFGKTAEVCDLVRDARVALGTDSRFSGGPNLLCEIKSACHAIALPTDVLESLVTNRAAALLRLSDRGTLKVGARADILVLPQGMALSAACRADIRLVVLGGRALYADPDYARVVAPQEGWVSVRVDGKTKMLESGLVEALRAASVREPGLEISAPILKAAS